MKTNRKTGVYIDHSHANIIEFGDAAQPIVEVHPEHGGNASHGSEHAAHKQTATQLNTFYRAVAKKLMGAEDILLFGPTTAKNELNNVLKDDHHFAVARIELQNAAALDERQQRETVKKHFNKFQIKSL